MKERCREVLRKGSADFMEIRIEDTRRLSVSYSGKELTGAQATRDAGGYVRALVKGGWGFASFNKLDELETYAAAAVAQARAVGGGSARLAPVEPSEASIELDLPAERDPRRRSLEEKVEFVGRLARRLLESHPTIISSNASYSEEDRCIIVANSEGTLIETEGLWAGGGMRAVGREGAVVQGVHHGFGTRTDWNDILAAEGHVDQVVRDTLDLVKAEPARGGRTTVILDPRLAAVFIHEAFGHLSEADNVASNEKLRAQMRIGTRFGQDHLNVIDSGCLPDERGSLAFDDEGTPAHHTYLIKDGLLAGRLHSRQTAGLMGEEPTGNARTVHYRFPPICRMTNTYIDAGPHSFDEMLEGVADGLYVMGGGSGNTSTGLFTFSAERARVVKNGRLGHLVRDFVLTGNVFETLASIDKVGSDLYRARSGGCGKSYGQRMQYPLMVSMGSPHIRIQNCLIGGR